VQWSYWGSTVRLSFRFQHASYATRRGLTSALNACVKALEEFRSLHFEYAATYIFQQAQTDSKNPHAVGTGGTPFMEYLKKHRDETGKSCLK
jgi:indoleamine 2,3-dioxygenase